MFGLKMIWQGFGAALLLTALMANPCSGQFTDYVVGCTITDVIENDNNVLPGLMLGSVADDGINRFGFTAILRYNRQGWNGTPGSISIDIRGVNLLFEGDSVFGGITGDPNYSYRIAADQAGAGADIRNSNFSPSNLALELEAFEDSTFPFDETQLAFDGAFAGGLETNRFTIEGRMLNTMGEPMERVHVIGFVRSVIRRDQFINGDVDDDDDADVEDINQFPDALGESALFFGDFDLDQDGVITLADHDMLINDFVNFSIDDTEFTGTLVGDINFDGCVDVLGDAFVLVASLGGPGPFGYQDGDLNADNLVTVLGDAFRLVANLGRSIK